MTYRVIQWATGNVGWAAIEGVVGHPDLVERTAARLV